MKNYQYNYPIYLASKSPRRRDFLDNLNIKYEIVDIDVDETVIKSENPEDYVIRVVNSKTLEGIKTLNKNNQSGVIITADTVVVLDNKIIQKPSSENEAIKFLKLMSGEWHTVITGYNIKSTDMKIDHLEMVKTGVKFKNLSLKEIQLYLSYDEYKDKAGAYAIQGMGGFMVEKIDGSYSNVIGFPIDKVFNNLILNKILIIN